VPCRYVTPTCPAEHLPVLGPHVELPVEEPQPVTVG